MARDKDAWFKFYSSDWLAGTAGLTAAERGVYITIIAMIYEARGAIPADRVRLARRCGVPAGSFARLLASLIVQGKIIETPEGLTNRRAEAEIGERENAMFKLQSGAHQTNAIRKEKAKQKQCEGKRLAHAGRDAIPEPEPEPYKKEHNTTAREAREVPKIVTIQGGKALDLDGLVTGLSDLCARANGGNLPAGWAGAEVGIIVTRWLQPPPDGLGLTPGEVLTVASRQLAHWLNPPYGPRSWDSAMAKFAGAKAAPPPQAISPRPRQPAPEPENYATRRLREIREGKAND